jgi:hypothetical protein
MPREVEAMRDDISASFDKSADTPTIRDPRVPDASPP